MKTVLYSNMKKKKIETPVGSDKGKIADFHLKEDEEDHWLVDEVMISVGTLKRDKKFVPIEEMELIEDEEKIKVTTPLEEASNNPLEPYPLKLKEMKGCIVETESGEEIGKVYDYEIATELDSWMVWKLLVKPTDLSPLKRRTKVAVKDVIEVKEDKIVAKDEYK